MSTEKTGVNKSDIVRIVSVKMGIPLATAEKAVSCFFDTITDGLADGKRAEIRGFGSFSAREYTGYTGRNPKTGEEVPIPPKVRPYFKAGKEIKNVLNK